MKENLGAAAARNRGLDESAAEWVLFLDDDVTPKEDTIEEYSRAIQGRAPEDTVVGAIGLTSFPPPETLHTCAVTLSDVTYMFGIAGRLDKPAWGVTANLLVRRPPKSVLRFREDCFPKTGGGEDVDFCLRCATSSPPGSRLK
jgi:GT2 family glycosyltransferase